MSKVEVFNRAQAENLCPMKEVAMISISTPGKPEAKFMGEWGELLRLQFHDVGDSEADHPGMIPFDENMADAVIDFIELAIKDNMNIYVHCDAGVSRSVAIGSFVSEAYNIPIELHAAHNTMLANGRVRRFVFRPFFSGKRTINIED